MPSGTPVPRARRRRTWPTMSGPVLLTDERLVTPPSSLATVSLGCGNLVLLSDLPATWRLSRIGVPTLMVVGEWADPDNRAIADLLEERIERATKITVGGAGHTIELDWPEEFDRIVPGFLRDDS